MGNSPKVKRQVFDEAQIDSNFLSVSKPRTKFGCLSLKDCLHQRHWQSFVSDLMGQEGFPPHFWDDDYLHLVILFH